MTFGSRITPKSYRQSRIVEQRRALVLLLALGHQDIAQGRFKDAAEAFALLEESETATDLEALWDDEAERRLAAHDSGMIASLDGEDVLAEARQLAR